VRLRPALAGAVEELGDRDLVRVDENCRAALRAVGDLLALWGPRAARASDDDKVRVSARVLRRGELVEGGSRSPVLLLAPGAVQGADERPEAAARGMDVEEVRGRVAGNGERVHDVGRDEHPGAGTGPNLAILEAERQLALEHEEALRVLRMEMERRGDAAAGLPSHGGEGDFVDVGEEHDAQLTLTTDPLALAEVRLHGEAA
jgi:hypothetical protein